MKPGISHLLSIVSLAFTLAASGAVTRAAAADVKPYPFKICVVSGNELGTMGKTVTKVYEGQEMKFCCKPCVKKFDANPTKYLAKLRK
ncbi:MAG: hypothetical protein RL693_1965 [Verrucomicrobiota bacterium]|jgi:YHS domain-containing protein